MAASSSWGGLLAQRSTRGYGVVGPCTPVPEPGEEFRAARTTLPVRLLARLAGTALPLAAHRARCCFRDPRTEQGEPNLQRSCPHAGPDSCPE